MSTEDDPMFTPPWTDAEKVAAEALFMLVHPSGDPTWAEWMDAFGHLPAEKYHVHARTALAAAEPHIRSKDRLLAQAAGGALIEKDTELAALRAEAFTPPGFGRQWAYELWVHLSDHVKQVEPGEPKDCEHCRDAEIDCDVCRALLAEWEASLSEDGDEAVAPRPTHQSLLAERDSLIEQREALRAALDRLRWNAGLCLAHGTKRWQDRLAESVNDAQAALDTLAVSMEDAQPETEVTR